MSPVSSSCGSNNFSTSSLHGMLCNSSLSSDLSHVPSHWLSQPGPGADVNAALLVVFVAFCAVNNVCSVLLFAAFCR